MPARPNVCPYDRLPHTHKPIYPIIMNRTKLKIGDFAKFMQVSIKTLRHYEMLGLLVPNEINENSGYRYYGIEQMQRLRAIQDLKALGFGLEEISNLAEEAMRSPTREQIEEKLLACNQQLEILTQRRKNLEATLQHRNELELMEQFELQQLPAITVASHSHIPDYESLGSICVQTIGPEMQRLGCECTQPGYCFTMEHSTEDENSDHPNIEYCEQVKEAKTDSPIIQFKHFEAVPTALCFKHRGPYCRFYASFAKVFAHIEEKGYRICGTPRISYVDGIWNQPNPEEWISIIQVPIDTTGGNGAD